MICKHIVKRSYKNQTYFYCRSLRKEITLEECKQCQNKEFKNYKPIKKKSNKLSKIERERDKDLVKKGICEYCGRYSWRLDPHEVYGGSNRIRSIKNNFVKKLCRDCHEDEDIINELRKTVQEQFEKEHTREEFINLIGMSYLK